MTYLTDMSCLIYIWKKRIILAKKTLRIMDSTFIVLEGNDDEDNALCLIRYEEVNEIIKRIEYFFYICINLNEFDEQEFKNIGKLINQIWLERLESVKE